MALAIRETRRTGAGTFDAEVGFDGGASYPVSVSDPFTRDREKRLEWYFEEPCGSRS